MAELINAYDSYGDFGRDAYFAVCFDIPPSKLCFRTRLTGNSANMARVMEELDLGRFDIRTVFRNWETKDRKDIKREEDYADEHLLKSASRKLMLWVTLYTEEVSVDFFYDASDAEAEQWVLDTNHHLRLTFGEEKGATFKVLTKNDSRFYAEDVSTGGDFSAIDVDSLYNDDFKEIDHLIMQSVSEDKSGLILLHGVPGTGKTSYIKHLISSFKDKPFFFIQNEFVRELLTPQFISFLLKHRNSALIIEDAEKVITSREYSAEGSVVSTILQLTDGLFSDYLNIKIICTFNSGKERIDPALFRKGRMIANYEFKPLSACKTRRLAQSLGFEPPEGEMTLADIFRMKEPGFQPAAPRKLGFIR